MKKFLVLSVMLFSSVVSFGQTDVLSVKDAVAISKGGIEVAHLWGLEDAGHWRLIHQHLPLAAVDGRKVSQ